LIRWLIDVCLSDPEEPQAPNEPGQPIRRNSGHALNSQLVKPVSKSASSSVKSAPKATAPPSTAPASVPSLPKELANLPYTASLPPLLDEILV
jgi:hypothetical protein